jgi:enterochelin esterase-like enzyme
VPESGCGSPARPQAVRQFPDWPQGRILRLPLRSKVLRANPWADPTERELCIYLPPGYDDGAAPYLALWDLAAFTNSGPGHLNWRGHGESLAQRLDRLIHQGKLAPVVVVMPDCFTSLGGNQYVDSPGVGAYAQYLVQELIPFVAEQVNVADGPAGRGAFGTSSGGYGALWHAMHFPDHWGAVAAHAADCGFDWVYRPVLPVACRVLAGYGGDPEQFIRAFWAARRPTGEDYTTLMVLAMAASYDPDPQHPRRIRLPMDLRSCTLDDERWQHWLEQDPLRLVEHHVDALKSLHGLYLDVGRRDEYHIQFGMRRLSDRLVELGVDHHFEEFDGTHRSLDWRLDLSLPWLAQRLLHAGGRPTENGTPHD